MNEEGMIYRILTTSTKSTKSWHPIHRKQNNFSHTLPPAYCHIVQSAQGLSLGDRDIKYSESKYQKRVFELTV